jgi:hypothetical protein
MGSLEERLSTCKEQRQRMQAHERKSGKLLLCLFLLS